MSKHLCDTCGIVHNTEYTAALTPFVWCADRGGVSLPVRGCRFYVQNACEAEKPGVITMDNGKRMQSFKTVCVYHDNCHDGITAAWIVRDWHRRSFGPESSFDRLTLVPGKYEEAPDLEVMRDAHVILVDFSYKRDVLQSILLVCESLLVLDHHKSAEHELANFPGANVAGGALAIHFDMHRSGAGMAWDYFNPGQARPKLVDHVEDRDLWRFALPNTRHVHFFSGLQPLTLEARDYLFAELGTPDGYARALDVGRAVESYHQQLVESATRYRPRQVIGGHSVPCVPCWVVQVISDAGHILAQGEPFCFRCARRMTGST